MTTDETVVITLFLLEAPSRGRIGLYLVEGARLSGLAPRLVLKPWLRSHPHFSQADAPYSKLLELAFNRVDWDQVAASLIANRARIVGED